MFGPVLGLIVIAVSYFSSADGASLRGQAGPVEAEQSFLTELAKTFRPGAAEDHIAALEEALRPMFVAVPHESDGRLGHAVVRYVLHRFFVQRFGWFVRGLEPNGKTHNTSVQHGNTSAQHGLQDLHDWVPAYLQGFLKQMQSGRGVSLRELAVLTATLEDLVHKEALRRLNQAYGALEYPVEQDLDETKVRQLLEVFMMIYMLGGDLTSLGKVPVLTAHNIFAKRLSTWSQLQEWTHEVQMEVAPAHLHSFNFNITALVVEEIGKRYGAFNNEECGRLKAELVDIESQKAGRVRLAEFYKKGLTGVFSFNEKADYLRTLGALDESEPGEPHVIVPNYVSSRPNCLVASSFYVVCCRNECEDYMGALEEKIQAEMADPERILEFVSMMSASAGTSPRALPATLVKRLESIAEHHHGQVPLHGRLFAQWMHHAFPRECPYPHGAGTTSPQTADEWMQENAQQEPKHSREEMQVMVDTDAFCSKPKGEEARAMHDFPENELPWDDMEELLRPLDDVLSTSAEEQALIAGLRRPGVRTIASMLGLSSVASGLAVFVWKIFFRYGKKSLLPTCA